MLTVQWEKVCWENGYPDQESYGYSQSFQANAEIVLSNSTTTSNFLSKFSYRIAQFDVKCVVYRH